MKLIKIPDDQRDPSRWTHLPDEGDYDCYLVPVEQSNILRNSGFNKVCVPRERSRHTRPSAVDFERWMNESDPDSRNPDTWYI